MTDSTDRTSFGTSDYDDWATNPDNLAFHFAGIARNLTRLSSEPTPQASIGRRWPYLVNVNTGHLNGYDLCWICASALVHSDARLPRMRACRWCLAEDRRHAAHLGLLHLLPVFDWPAPPVIDDALAASLDPDAREATTAAWSEVSTLDRWRRDSVQLSYAYMDVPPGAVVDLFDWQQRLTIGSNRSHACWSAYVDGYHPALRQAVHRRRTHGLVPR